MLTLSSAFDVVGLLGRNIKSINNIISLTHDLNSSRNYPKKILYPKEFFPHSDPIHQAMVNEYVVILEAFLGVKKTEFSLVERWAQCPPPEAEGKSLKDYLNKVVVVSKTKYLKLTNRRHWQHLRSSAMITIRSSSHIASSIGTTLTKNPTQDRSLNFAGTSTMLCNTK